MSAQHNSASSSSNLSYICTLFPQITSKIDQYNEENLHELDKVVSQYISKRLEMRQSILKLLEEDSIQTDEMNFNNLLVLRNYSQNSLLELGKQESRFNECKEQLRERNLHITQDLFHGEDRFNELDEILSLCKRLIIKLSEYIDVGKFVEDLAEYRNSRGNLGRSKTFVNDVDQYLSEMDQIFKTPNETEENSILEVARKSMRKNSDWEPSTKDVSQNNSIPWAKKNRIEKPYFNFHDEAPKFSLLLNMIE